MNTKTSIVIGSLLGACAIQVITTACGSSRHASSSGMAGTGEAHAQPTSASDTGCTAWQTGVSYYQVNAPYLALNNTSNIPQNQALAVNPAPPGWEPLAVNVVSYGSATSQAGLLVYMRQCTAH
jgi:hypothetical protein